jgi:hypothetical protein
MVPNIVWQECMTPFNVVWQTPEPTEGRDNSLPFQWGIGQNEVKNTYYTLLPVGQSVRWWSGQWSGYMVYHTTHPYILPLITFTCLLFGGVNTYYYICIHIISI